MTLTFDRGLPSLAQGNEMVFAAADMRGSGSSIEDNLIENIMVQRNVIRGASNSGINVSDVTVRVSGGVAPSHGITIQGDSIERVLSPQAARGRPDAQRRSAAIASPRSTNALQTWMETSALHSPPPVILVRLDGIC
jgi:hypothetical protein